jgi:hypothetical protein
MKTTLFSILLVLGWLPVGIVARAAETPAGNSAPKFSWIERDDPAVADIVRTGERHIEHVGGSLIGEVNRVLAKNSPGTAVDILHLRNYTSPKAAPGQPVVTAVKRTSLRVRNPVNAPDEGDQLALDLIKDRMNEGLSPPDLLVQRVDRASRPVEWRVYRPIGVATRCLTCHGDKEQISLEVQAVLELRYPQDRATGYTSNQWRGLIRISLEKPAPPAAK